MVYFIIGDVLIYLIYGYVLVVVCDLYFGCDCVMLFGIISYVVVVVVLEWLLGVGKECMLILFCLEDVVILCIEIESYDIVVLMKVGVCLLWVLVLLWEMGIV